MNDKYEKLKKALESLKNEVKKWKNACMTFLLNLEMAKRNSCALVYQEDKHIMLNQCMAFITGKNII